MGNFNRGNRSGGERSYRPSSFNRGSDRQVEMQQAVCAKCGQNCEIPFRPTNDRPVYCSSCFENNRNSDSRSEGRSFVRPSNSEDREMFTATCADCGSSCQVPFKPTNGKPVFCSNCFGDKKEGNNRRSERPNSQPQDNKQLEAINSKLDKILAILAPNTASKEDLEEIAEEIKEVTEDLPVEVVVEKKVKVAKKKAPVKK
ncbi:MAG: CxxC-x17-CxxC domain-containing protein [Microgenomates group bacterium]|jgi:CxxC-x17-CxxC domain-containing protein